MYSAYGLRHIVVSCHRCIGRIGGYESQQELIDQAVTGLDSFGVHSRAVEVKDDKNAPKPSSFQYGWWLGSRGLKPTSTQHLRILQPFLVVSMSL